MRSRRAFLTSLMTAGAAAAARGIALPGLAADASRPPGSAAAGPFFVREWHLASPAALTFAFSATNFGVLFGAPLFGFMGDRYGRKPAILLSLIAFGIWGVVSG